MLLLPSVLNRLSFQVKPKQYAAVLQLVKKYSLFLQILPLEQPLTGMHRYFRICPHKELPGSMFRQILQDRFTAVEQEQQPGAPCVLAQLLSQG